MLLARSLIDQLGDRLFRAMWFFEFVVIEYNVWVVADAAWWEFTGGDRIRVRKCRVTTANFASQKTDTTAQEEWLLWRQRSVFPSRGRSILYFHSMSVLKGGSVLAGGKCRS